MRLRDLATPCLVLDRGILTRNIRTMAADVAGHGIALRPHMKTAKCIDVARMALEAGAKGSSGNIRIGYHAIGLFLDFRCLRSLLPRLDD